MSRESKLSPAGNEIVEALDGFLTTLKQGGDISRRYTVRTIRFDLKPRDYTGEDLRATRRELGLSQALFADFLGVSVQSIRAWERGGRAIPRIVCRFLDEFAVAPAHWRDRVDQLIGTKEHPATRS